MKTSKARINFLNEVGRSLLDLPVAELRGKFNSIDGSSDISNILIEGRYLSSREDYVPNLGSFQSLPAVASASLVAGSLEKSANKKASRQ